MELRAFELVDTLDAKRTGLEGAHAGGNDHNLRHKAGAGARFNVETAVFLLFNARHFLAEMEDRTEVMVLLKKIFREFVGGADRHGGNVVDGLRGIELHALAADVLQGVDNVALDFEEAEFKHLEKADGARADDNRIGFNQFVARLGDGHVIFNSHFLVTERVSPHQGRSR